MSGGRVGDAVKRALAAKGRAWSIDVPKGWEHEAEDALDTFLDPDGVGALQISTVTNTTGDVADADLVELVEHMKLAHLPRTPVSFGPFAGFTVRSADEDGQIGDFWFLRAGPLLLFATYFCEQAYFGKESATVAKALRSLRLA